jgi:iron complex transport system substrate-binding protein
MNPKHIKKRPEWSDVTAVHQDKIYVLEESLFCRPSPRLIEGLQKIASILHPEIYPSTLTGNPF